MVSKNKKRIMSIIAMISCCIVNSSNNYILGKENEVTVTSKKQLKEEQQYENAEKYFFGRIALLEKIFSDIIVENIEDGIVYLSYKPSKFALILPFGITEWNSTYNLKDRNNLNEIFDYFFNKAINSTLEGDGSFAAWVTGRKTFSELFNDWKGKDEYEKKISKIRGKYFLVLKECLEEKIEKFQKTGKK